MVIYNTTVVNKEDTFKSLVKTTRKGLISKYVLAIIILIFGIILLAYGFLTSDTSFTGMGYVFLVFGVAYISLNTYSWIKTPKKVFEVNKEVCQYGMTYEYTFKEQSFQVVAICIDKKTKLPYTYDVVKKIYEYEDLYEFILTERKILYINKNGFESKKHEELFIKTVQKNKKKIITKIKSEVKNKTV